MEDEVRIPYPSSYGMSLFSLYRYRDCNRFNVCVGVVTVIVQIVVFCYLCYNFYVAVMFFLDNVYFIYPSDPLVGDLIYYDLFTMFFAVFLSGFIYFYLIIYTSIFSACSEKVFRNKRKCPFTLKRSDITCPICNVSLNSTCFVTSRLNEPYRNFPEFEVVVEENDEVLEDESNEGFGMFNSIQTAGTEHHHQPFLNRNKRKTIGKYLSPEIVGCPNCVVLKTFIRSLLAWFSFPSIFCNSWPIRSTLYGFSCSLFTVYVPFFTIVCFIFVCSISGITGLLPGSGVFMIYFLNIYTSSRILESLQQLIWVLFSHVTFPFVIIETKKKKRKRKRKNMSKKRSSEFLELEER